MTLLSALVTGSWAATLVVDPSAGPYTDIASALAVAASGDTLALSADTFTECIDAGLSFTLQGQAGTVLDGTGLCDNTLTVDDGETVQVHDLEMIHAGGRSVNLYYSNLRLDNVTLRDSGDMAWSGGAIHTYGGLLETTDCLFQDNVGAYGGAVYLYAYGAWADSGSAFSGNRATSGGGGVYSYYDNDVSLTGTVFTDNSSLGQGGGMWHGWYGGTVLDALTFTGNTATGSGGALMLYAIDDVIPITSSAFVDNHSLEGNGGAVEMEWYADLEISDSRFEGNTAALSNGGAVSSLYYAHLTVTDSTFTDNAGLYGGAVRHYPYEGKVWDLTVTGSSFVGNTSSAGGAILVDWTRDIRLSDNHFEGNRATDGTGGALDVYVSGSVEAHHNRFCANAASASGGGMFLEWIDADAYWNNDWIDNTGEYGGALYRYQAPSGSLSHDSFVGNSAAEDGGAYFASYGYADWHSNIVAHTATGNGAYSSDPYSRVNSTMTHSGWADNHNVHAGGYWWVEDGLDGNVVAEDPGFVSYDGCQSDLRLRGQSPFKDIGRDTDRGGSVSDAGSSGGSEGPLEDADVDGYDTSEDCDDTSDDVNPGMLELCNGIDDDCSGGIDDSPVDQGTWYMDADGDGWGGSPLRACTQPEGSVEEDGDCDDLDPDVHPEAAEVLDDGVDQDCDGSDAASTPGPDGGCGGCSAGATPGQGWLILLGLLVLRRRR